MNADTVPDAQRASAPRRRQPGQFRRRQIADAALAIIARHGLRRFTARAVAEAVGVSDAAIFRHLPSKEAIVLEALDRVEEVLFHDFPPVADDPVERLGRFFHARVAAVKEHPGIARLMFSEDLAFAGGPGGAERIARLKRHSVGFVQDCLGEAKRRRQLAPGLGPREATVLVVGALMALLHAGIQAAGDERADPRLVWATLERLLRGTPSRKPRKEKKP